MKLRQIITENKEEDFIKKYFMNADKLNVTNTSDGINVIGDLYIKEGVSLNEVPFKINKVDGTLDLMNCDLKSLKNVPNRCTKLIVSHNSLLSLACDSPVDTVTFDASDNPMENLAGLKIGPLDSLRLRRCVNLKTIKGIEDVKIGRLNLEQCSNFQDDLSKYENINSLRMDIADSQNMPMVFLIAFGRPRLAEVKSKSEDLNKILQKYYNKGAGVVLDLMRELRDLGLVQAAKIR